MTNRITKYCSTLGVQKQLGGGKKNPHGYIYLLTQKPVTHVLLSKI